MVLKSKCKDYYDYTSHHIYGADPDVVYNRRKLKEPWNIKVPRDPAWGDLISCLKEPYKGKYRLLHLR